MHPREGWSEGGRRLVRGASGAKGREHASEQHAAASKRLLRDPISRRDFLTTAGAALGLGSLGGLLGACGGSSGSTATTSSGGIPLPRPNNPVKWPLFTSNAAIKSGLQPEQNATLQIYNWVAYVNETVVKSFCKKFKCNYEITTFNTMSEALAKLASGEVKFDVFFPTVDVLGSMIETKLLRPLNHSYIPNISNCWPDYENPFYDEGWQYTTPYSIYTTGMAWRKDKVSIAPGWDMPWKASAYKGKVALLDDYREGISLALMKNGVFDLNATSTSQIQAAGSQLQDLTSLVGVRIDNNDYTEVPDANTWIHHAWSGDMAAAGAYLPKGTPISVVGYWFPPDGKGPVANDLMTVLSTGSNPVLSHLFMNYLLDVDNAIENYSYVGYMQPLTAVTPDKLIAEKLLPPSLRSTVVLPSYFSKGLMELQLPASANDVWEQSWNTFSKGL
jgi:spermidine/putrescine transport system substrate-binding protein